MAWDFLQVKMPLVGQLKANRAIHDSVNRRIPYLKELRYEDTARTFEYVAQALLAADVIALRKGRQEAEALAAALAKDAPAAPLPSQLDDYVRRHPRVPVHLEGRLDAQKVTVVDLSEGGALLECKDPPTVGSTAALKISEQHTTVRIQVCNVREGAFVGVQFLDGAPELISATPRRVAAEPSAIA
jgi:hypothetical protein